MLCVGCVIGHDDSLDWDPVATWDGATVTGGDSLSNSTASDPMVTRPPYNLWDQVVNATVSSMGVADLAFHLGELDLFSRLGDLLHRLIFGNDDHGGLQADDDNSTDVGNVTSSFNSTTGGWSLVSVVVLMPLRCADVERAVALLQAAVQEANPDTNVTSDAQRLGDEPCDEGVCLCTQDDGARARLLEIRSAPSFASSSAFGSRLLNHPDPLHLPFPLVRWGHQPLPATAFS